MKTLFRFFAPLAFAVMLFTGCDSNENPNQLPMPESESQSIGIQSKRTNVSDQELQKAAAVYVEIQDINEQMQESVRKTHDSNERQQLQLQANEKMVQAAESAGLDFVEYNNIIQTIQTNHALKAKFDQKVNNMR